MTVPLPGPTVPRTRTFPTPRWSRPTGTCRPTRWRCSTAGTAPDAGQERLRRDYLDHLAAHPDARGEGRPAGAPHGILHRARPDRRAGAAHPAPQGRTPGSSSAGTSRSATPRCGRRRAARRARSPGIDALEPLRPTRCSSTATCSRVRSAAVASTSTCATPPWRPRAPSPRVSAESRRRAVVAGRRAARGHPRRARAAGVTRAGRPRSRLTARVDRVGVLVRLDAATALGVGEPVEEAPRPLQPRVRREQPPEGRPVAGHQQVGQLVEQHVVEHVVGHVAQPVGHPDRARRRACTRPSAGPSSTPSARWSGGRGRRGSASRAARPGRPGPRRRGLPAPLARAVSRGEHPLDPAVLLGGAERRGDEHDGARAVAVGAHGAVAGGGCAGPRRPRCSRHERRTPGAPDVADGAGVAGGAPDERRTRARHAGVRAQPWLGLARPRRSAAPPASTRPRAGVDDKESFHG